MELGLVEINSLFHNISIPFYCERWKRFNKSDCHLKQITNIYPSTRYSVSNSESE